MDGSGCYFQRQPETPDETEDAARAVWSSCCGAVRYDGTNQRILEYLDALQKRSENGDAYQAGLHPAADRAQRLMGSLDKNASPSEVRQCAHEECSRRGVLYAERELLEAGEFIPILRRLRRWSALKLGATTLFVLLEILAALLMYTTPDVDGGGFFSPTLPVAARLLMLIVATVMWIQALRESMRCGALIKALENDRKLHNTGEIH